MALSINDIFKKSFLENFSNNISITNIVMTLLLTLLLSLIVFMIYKVTSKNILYSKKFNITIALISIITSAVVLSMQANITVSLGMVGALSIVRFRTAIKEPRDLLFLFWSISNGIIIGSGIYMIAIILSIILSISMLLFDIIPENKSRDILVIYYKNTHLREIEIILKSYKVKYKMKSNNLSSKESSVIYEVRSPKSKDFLDVLFKVNGVNEVNLMNQDSTVEY